MSVLIAVMSVFGTAGTIMLLGTQDFGIGTGAQLAIIAPLILLTVYCLARIPRKEEEEEEEKSAYATKSAIIGFFEREEPPSVQQLND